MSLFERLPRAMRQHVMSAGGFQSVCGDFVSRHVQQPVTMLVDMLREKEGFEDELEKLDTRPDYVEAARENDLCLLDDDGVWAYFDWDDPSTIPVGRAAAESWIDFPRFAQDKGLRIEDWRWRTDTREPQHKDAPVQLRFHPQAWQKDQAIDVDPLGDVEWTVPRSAIEDAELPQPKDADFLRDLPQAPEWVRKWDGPFYVSIENEEDFGPVFDGPVLDGVAELDHSDGSDLMEVLAFVAEHQGLAELAADLRNTSKTKALFENYLKPDSTLSVSDYDSEAEAAEAACNEHRIDVSAPDAYEYWLVDEYLARQLEKHGEVVAHDFCNDLTVWARTTSGQAISIDSVIERIVRTTETDAMDELVRKLFPNLGSNDERLAGVQLDLLKALEEGRLRLAEFGGKDNRSTRFVVLAEKPKANAAPGWDDEAWILSERDTFYGIKDRHTNPAEPVALSKIREDWARPSQRAFKVTELSDEDRRAVLEGIARYHQANAKAADYQLPERYEERMQALGWVEESSPSLGR